MNKDVFFKRYDDELSKILKGLPVLDNLSSNYSKNAYILMIYANFEGFTYRIIFDFYEFLKNEKKRQKIINAHYDFCINLFNKDSKKIWQKFRPFKKNIFKKDNNCLIDTNDNLGYEIFIYLLFLLNISEFSKINTKYYSKTLDEVKKGKDRYYCTYKEIINLLLEKRNDIAHGNSIMFSKDFLTQEIVENISDGITIILRQLKNDIFDIIENELYIL